jgi:hypothetical protein
MAKYHKGKTKHYIKRLRKSMADLMGNVYRLVDNDPELFQVEMTKIIKDVATLKMDTSGYVTFNLVKEKVKKKDIDLVMKRFYRLMYAKV